VRAHIQAGIYSFCKLGERARSESLERLAREINDGSCSSRYGKLLKQESMDCGYRFVRIGKRCRLISHSLIRTIDGLTRKNHK